MLKATGYPLPLTDSFVEVLDQEISNIDLEERDGCILIYFDPFYSYKDGGLLPSQIALSDEAEILYIAQLAYYRKGKRVKLGRKLHVNFLCDVYQHKGRNCSKETIKKLFDDWQFEFVLNIQEELVELTLCDLNLFEP